MSDQVLNQVDQAALTTGEHLRVVTGEDAAQEQPKGGLEAGTQIRLYHFPTSPSSQQVRLALAEKKVDWASTIVNIGPAHENFEPWYAALNPRLVVPTLHVGDEVVTDASAIVSYIDETFADGTELIPEEPQERLEATSWVEARDRFPLRELTYSRTKGMMRWFQRWSLRQQRKRLVRLIRRNPPLREIYEDKLRALDHFELSLRDRAVTGELVEVEATLDEMESVLAERRWLAGEHYSIADLTWTPVLAKLEHIGFARSISERRRPELARWYAQVRARPSWGSMIRRLTPMQALRFYGPAVAKSLAIAWLIKWAITGVVVAIGWLLAHR